MKSTDNNFNALIKRLHRPSIPKSSNSAFRSETVIARYRLRVFKEYLAPDSNPYFTTMNPMFGFELELESASIQAMPVISFRDGVMPLLRFFSLHPSPKNAEQIYIVDSELSSLVPPAWRSQVLLRSFYTEQSKYTSLDKKTDKLLLISPTEEVLPMDLLVKELDALSEKIEDGDNLLLFFSFAKLRAPGIVKKDESWGYTVLSKIFERFPKNKIQILKWTELQSLDVSSVKYHYLNPLKFYLADSFLDHDLGQKGARPIFEKTFLGTEYYQHRVSINHGFFLHQEFQEFNSFGSEKLVTQIMELQSEYGTRDRRVHSQLFCTDEFNSWAKDVSRKIFSLK